MPLIVYPDVPRALGVPDVNRLAQVATSFSTDISVLSGGDGPGIDAGDQFSAWQILDQSGSPVIVPDSVIGFEYRGDQRVASHPVERGSFTVYNKTASPFDVRLRMTCGGQESMTRDQFIAQLDAMCDSIDLYTIVTPDRVYESVNLDHVDYRRESRNGVTLLTVEAWFTEIRVTATKTYSSTAAPSGASTTSTGTVQPSAPSADVTGALAAAGVH